MPIMFKAVIQGIPYIDNVEQVVVADTPAAIAAAIAAGMRLTHKEVIDAGPPVFALAPPLPGAPV